jgi:ribonuclease P protein component
MAPGSRERFKFPKASRLTRTAEFALVKKNGQAWTGRHITLAILYRAGESTARLGIITTRRIGQAVVRNRVRRRLREIFRLNQHRLITGIWIVTIARCSAAETTFRQLERDWLRLAGRASILAPASHGQVDKQL